MSLHDYYQEVAQNAVADDVAILCDDPATKTRISATLLQLTLASAQTKREPLLFVVQEDVHAARHQAWLGPAGIRSTVVEASTALAMTKNMWAAILLQTQVIVTSGRALLLMLQNGIFEMKEVAHVVLDICRKMTQGDAFRQLIEGYLRAEMLRPRLTAFLRSTEPSLEYLLTATLVRPMTASIDGAFLVASATQVCRLIRCDGFMGAEEPLDAACNHLVTLCRGNELLATALESYEHAKAHLGSWCSAHIWTFALQACREEALALPRSATFLRLLEHVEQVSRDIELTFPLPTWKGVSEKLWRLVALLRSPENGTIHPALVLVSSIPSALVIAKFLERVKSLGPQVGMQGARVTCLISTSGPAALQAIDGFENGQSNVLVVPRITSQGLPLNLCSQVIQFDVAKLRGTADLANHYMVVRINHPLAGFLGGLFLKAMVCTDVFVTNLNGKPGDLTRDSSRIFTSIRHNEREKTAFGMAYIADGPIGALRSLAQMYTQIPRPQGWVDFADEYRRSILRQRPRLTASTTAATATVQRTLGYTFSNAQVLLDALSRGTRQCERLEFVGDAVLDLVAAVYWSGEHPTVPKDKLSSLKAASVCNNFLAMVFMELGLHTSIQCNSQFHGKLAKVLLFHTAMLDANQTGDFWMEVDYPKDIADVMEAVFGAVYIDSEFDIGAVAAVFTRCLLPFIQEHLPIDCLVFSPSKLKLRCEHLQFVYGAGPRAHDGGESRVCSVMLGGSVLESATGTKDVLAMRTACKRIVERLNSNPHAFAGFCQCFS